MTFDERRRLKVAVSEARKARVPHASGAPRLSQRERQVLALANRGLRTPEIAAHVGLAFSTTADYLRCARVKLALFEVAA